jgi:phage shock protein A
MRKQTVLWASLMALALTFGAWAQGIDTAASKDDWEEINFEQGSCVLVDGFPSLVRAADQLAQHADYRIQVTGHGDGTGARNAAEKLGNCRAAAVRDYLLKHGARPNQVQTNSVGNTAPKTDGKTREGRFMNRRAETKLTNGQGQPVPACPCDEVKALQDELNRLRQQLANANAQNQQSQGQVNQLQNQVRDLQNAQRNAGTPGATSGGGAGVAGSSAAADTDAMRRLRERIAQLDGQADELKRRVDAAAAANPASASLKQLQTDANALAADARALRARSVTAGPGDAAALEAQANDVQRRLDDLRSRLNSETGKGAVGSKMPRFSLLGANVGVDSNHDATFTGSGRYFAPLNKNHAVQLQGEYMYFAGRREAQGDIGLVNRWKDIQIGGFASFRNVWMKNTLSTGTMGQASFLADYLFGPGKVGIYGSKTFLNDAVINRPPLAIGGTAQLETYLHAVDTLGATGAVAFLKNNPKSPWVDGNLGWLKTAGGNKKAGGTLRLVFPVNEMLALTAEGGVNESLVGNSNYGRAVFGILFGQQTHPTQYKAAEHPIPMMVPRVRYELMTRRIGNGAPVADAGLDQFGIAPGTVTLDGSNSKDPDGDPLTFLWTQVAGPSVTLTAPNTARPSFTASNGQAYAFRLLVSDGTASSVARVAVTSRDTARPVITRFSATPSTITRGQSSTLNWVVENADNVTISAVTQTLARDSGTVSVSPAQTTNYVLTATNSAGQATAVAAVTVNSPSGAPVVTSFTASPSTIAPGGASTLSWNVTGADTVSISPGIGSVGANSSTSVSPAATTTYTLTATNAQGQTISTATVTVTGTGSGQVKITSFTVQPDRVLTGAGGNIRFDWTTENATSVTLEPGGGERGLNGTVSFQAPSATRTYTLRAVGAGANNVDTKTVTVRVESPLRGPQIVVPLSNIITIFRALQLDARGSFDPNGSPLTFEWRSVDGHGQVLNPNQGLTQIYLDNQYAGDFVFEVKVTNAAGESATRRVTVTLASGGCSRNDSCRSLGGR